MFTERKTFAGLHHAAAISVRTIETFTAPPPRGARTRPKKGAIIAAEKNYIYIYVYTYNAFLEQEAVAGPGEARHATPVRGFSPEGRGVKARRAPIEVPARPPQRAAGSAFGDDRRGRRGGAARRAATGER